MFVDVVPVISARDMFEAVTSRSRDMDIIIKAAAVADYRPSQVADEKVKKSDAELSIPLERTDDILKFLGDNKSPASSSADSLWKPRICWRIPRRNW